MWSYSLLILYTVNSFVKACKNVYLRLAKWTKQVLELLDSCFETSHFASNHACYVYSSLSSLSLFSCQAQSTPPQWHWISHRRGPWGLYLCIRMFFPPLEERDHALIKTPLIEQHKCKHTLWDPALWSNLHSSCLAPTPLH